MRRLSRKRLTYTRQNLMWYSVISARVGMGWANARKAWGVGLPEIPSQEPELRRGGVQSTGASARRC